MQYAILSNGLAKGLADHAQNNIIGYTPSVVGVFVDHPLRDTFDYVGPIANSSIGVKTFTLDTKLRARFYEEEMKIVGDEPDTTLYALFNGERFSDWLEISHSTKLMSGNVGPSVGLSAAVGIRVAASLSDAVQNFSQLAPALRSLGYRGEVLCGLSRNFNITGINFGHFPAQFGTFNESCKQTTQECLDFIFGHFPECVLYPAVTITNLISKSPFPFMVTKSETKIVAPKAAEKHLWRVLLKNGSEIVYVTVHGKCCLQARNRFKATARNMKKYDPEIQYRNDVGFHQKFVLSEDQYQEFLRVPERSPRKVDRENKSDDCKGNGGEKGLPPPPPVPLGEDLKEDPEATPE